MITKFDYSNTQSVSIDTIYYNNDNHSIEFSFKNNSGVLIKSISYSIIMKDDTQNNKELEFNDLIPDGAKSKTLSLDLGNAGLGKIVINRITYSNDSVSETSEVYRFGDIESIRKYAKELIESGNVNKKTSTSINKNGSFAHKPLDTPIRPANDERYEEKEKVDRVNTRLFFMALLVSSLVVILGMVLLIIAPIYDIVGTVYPVLILMFPVLPIALFITGIVLVRKNRESKEKFKENGHMVPYTISIILFALFLSITLIVFMSHMLGL